VLTDTDTDITDFLLMMMNIERNMAQVISKLWCVCRFWPIYFM